jgi:hypothetical protein
MHFRSQGKFLPSSRILLIIAEDNLKRSGFQFPVKCNSWCENFGGICVAGALITKSFAAEQLSLGLAKGSSSPSGVPSIAMFATSRVLLLLAK